MTAMIVLILFVPAATVLAAHYCVAAALPAATPSTGGQVIAASGNATTVALISVPFLAAGLLIMVAYRKGVALYQGWHGRKAAAPGPQPECR